MGLPDEPHVAHCSRGRPSRPTRLGYMRSRHELGRRPQAARREGEER
jgi:hypothetical protein